ncbi:hypothetical protein P9209_29385 [Prescottella defluvii]|nr:hypothetical protein P9209_29385 [Prescottella defluvii]
MRWQISARCQTPTLRHSAWARWAASTALSRSAVEGTGMVPMWPPVTGLITSTDWPVLPSV